MLKEVTNFTVLLINLKIKMTNYKQKQMRQKKEVIIIYKSLRPCPVNFISINNK